MCMSCRSLFVLLSFFFSPLCCLFFFNIRILITPLISSISSWTCLRYFNLDTFISHVYLHKEYIPLSGYAIPQLVIPIMVSLRDSCCKQGSYWANSSQGLSSGQHFMTWLIAMEHLFQKCSQIYSVCRNHNLVLSSLTTYHWVCNKIITTGITSGAGTVYPSGAPEFIPGFSEVHVARSLVFWALFCRSLFNPFFLFVFSLCCLFFELCF